MFVDVFALAGADVGPGATDSSPSLTASLAGASAGTLGFRFIGGGRFFPPAPVGLVAGGAMRVGIGGSGSGGDSVGFETFSWSSLKLRLERIGIVARAQTVRDLEKQPCALRRSKRERGGRRRMEE